mmetsp:Transcript_116844/g.337622  ORF Transcript_116844/g.337622 Transcript_116844/m.337622 type:complete len:613 (-) Transcript_116844:180-2018(-)
MTIYYDPLVCFPRVQWSKTIYPRVLRNFEFWLCILAHGGMVSALRLGYWHPDAGAGEGEHAAIVPIELAAPLLGLWGISAAQLLNDRKRWNEAFFAACARVGEHTRRFTQELQASFGLVEEVVALRFAAGKYALAAVYVFFFSLTSGSVTARGWSELRAKGVLDDSEVAFLENQYTGDRLALLHVWAMWAVQEAASSPAARAKFGPEATAAAGTRLAEALRASAEAAREAGGCAAVPVPYYQFQLHDTLTFVSLLVLAALAAPYSADGIYGASVVYLAVLVAGIAIREAAAALTDPFRKVSGQSFPVAATVNTTADVVAQLLIGAAPAAFNPCPMWQDAQHTILSQNQIERRTPAAAFGTEGANPWHWEPVKPPQQGDQAPPPLLDSGCCHLDVDSLPRIAAAARKGAHSFQVARRPRQEALGALLTRVQLAAEAKGLHGFGKAYKAPSTTTGGEPSESGSGSGSDLGASHRHAEQIAKAGARVWPTDDEACESSAPAMPREQTLSTSIAGRCYAGAVGASKARAQVHRGPSPAVSRDDSVIVSGAWATPADPSIASAMAAPAPSALARVGLSVSPDDLVLRTTPSGDSIPAAEFSAIAPPAAMALRTSWGL